MTDLESVRRVATRVRGLGITRRSVRDRMRVLVAEADRARDRKEWVAAARLYREALELDPLQFGVRVQLGHAYKELGDLANAGMCYRGALQLAPTDDDIYLQIGHLEKIKGNPHDAAAAYRKAVELNPQNRDAVTEYAAVAGLLGLPTLSNAISEVSQAIAVTGPINGASQGTANGKLEAALPLELRVRGDRARDARNWDEAAAAYEAYLANSPDDFAIWVQLGHALKERGDYPASEAAYRNAIARAPQDGDAYLHLGHLLKLRGRSDDAIEAYRRSFELQPLLGTLFEVRALDPGGGLLPLPPPATARAPIVILDISDLVIHLKIADGISGIQRVQLGLLNFVGSKADMEAPCRFAVWHEKQLWLLPAEAALRLAADAGAPRKQRQKLIAEIEAAAVLYAPLAGDVVVATGVLYLTPDLTAARERLKRAGVVLGAYIHDFIPLTHPEFCAEVLTADFSRAASEALLHLDFVLTTSKHVAGEARRLLAAAGYPAVPVEAVPLAQSFEVTLDAAGSERWGPAIEGLRGRDFVLCVGTLCAHKNQDFLVQVWQLLVQEGYEPPLLVLTGSRNLGADDVLNRLARSRNVDGRVRVIDTPSDEDLATLYRNCLFTMFPSLVEGWGLPIGESLAHGKLCIASRLTSMPEVGGDCALYIDPYNLRGCADLLRDLFTHREKIAAAEARIRGRFKPRLWGEHAGDFLAAVTSTAQAVAGGQRLLCHIEPGTMLRPRAMPEGWRFGRALPPYAEFAAAAAGRAVLVSGWHPPENWGVWMAGRRAELAFRVTLPPRSAVTIVLHCRAASATEGMTLNVLSGCGARAAAGIPEPNGPDRRPSDFLVPIDCTVAKDGSVQLLLEAAPAMAGDRWSGPIIGLLRIACLPPTEDAVQPENRHISPAALCGSAGEPVRPIGLQTTRLALRGKRLLRSGWTAPDATGVWMDGSGGRLDLATAAAPGDIVRVVLQVRTGSAPGGIDLDLAAGCGAASRRRLRGDASGELVWLDCRVGDAGRISLELRDRQAGGNGGRRRLGLIGLAYGRRGTAEDRLALTEALLFPAEGDLDAAELAVLADLRFTIAGHLRGSYSLAVINRSLALGLEEAFPGRVRVEQLETDPVQDLRGVPAAEREMLARMAERTSDPAGAEVAIVQHWPVIKPPAQCDLPLGLFVWEESLVPGDIVEHFNRQYRGVLAQTAAVKKALLDSGIAIPVHQVGCAIDLSRFAEIAERRAQCPGAPVSPDHPFVFLHVSSCFPRKGADLLLAAFAEAFRRDDPVKLVIKTFPNPHNEVAEQIESLRADNPGVPPIELINQDLDEPDLLRLYETADAMVLPTRGEGFNMPAAEAMAAGLPLIVTGHGGHLDFVSEDVARLLDYRFAPSHSHVRAAGSLWVEPDVDDLIAALRETFARARGGSGRMEGFAAQIERGRKAVAALADRATWGRRVADAARVLVTVEPARRAKIGWVSTWDVRCGIAEYSRHLLAQFPARRDVTIFCEDRTAPKTASPPGGPRVEVAWRMLDDDSMEDLAAAIDRAGVDAVVVQQHVGFIRWSALVRLLRDPRVASRPVIVLIHNIWYLSREDGRSRAAIVDALRRAARVLVHSVDDLNTLRSYGLADNVALFPHGAEQAGLTPPAVRSVAPGDTPRIGAYGFFLPPKRFDRLIRALPLLHARWRGLRLRFVTAQYPEPSSADELARCRELARSLGVARAIEWITEYLPNRRSLELLNECDLIALPYQETNESASGAVRVAIASRTPVIVTPIRIFEELDDAVLRFDGSEDADIAAGIAAALADPARRQQTIDNAGRWLADHDWTTLAARLHGMAAGLLATRRTGG